jgi:hypothetical protein
MDTKAFGKMELVGEVDTSLVAFTAKLVKKEKAGVRRGRA